MSNHPTNNTATEEIDLGYLIHKLGVLFRKSVKKLFEVIAFLIKFKFIVIAILLIGFGYGYYKDKTALKTYQNEVIVIPNFESVDYLYSQAEILNAKIRQHDTLFLRKVFDKDMYYLRNVEVEPIVDIFSFISQAEENIDIFRILVYNQDFENYIEDENNYKYNKYHRLKVGTSGDQRSERIISKLLAYLNTNTHYQEYQKLSIENTALQLAENKRMITQVDSLIAAATRGTAVGGTSITVFTDNANKRNDLLRVKQDLLDNQLRLQKRSKDEQAVLKEVSSEYNIVEKKGLYIPEKIKTPLLWLFIFCFIFFLKYMYFKLKDIAEENK